MKIKVYRTVVWAVVVYGCQTWTVTLREQHRLRVFENRVLREISVPKKKEMTGGWRRLYVYNEDLYDLYFSPIVIWVISSRTMKWVGHVARTKDKRGAYNILGRGNVWERHHLGDLGVNEEII
jgi:hypothetical protein